MRDEFPDAEFVDRSTFDITNPASWESRNWRQYQAIINAAAYTKVDEAETREGRKQAWLVNVEGVKNLAKVATENHLTLIHISTDYVFDGVENKHDEGEVLSPLGVYGQTKAAGDMAAATVPKHYIVRTSWVVGDGNNFVKTMKSLAEKGVKPSVVDDQVGRPTFADDLAKSIKHLVGTTPAYGTYNVSGAGVHVSWADLAKRIYELTGHDASNVTGVTTENYYSGKQGTAPRPLQSTLALEKIIATGFTPTDWDASLQAYLSE